jgi:uncharacterized damage-inducible protein DinB
MTEGLMTSQRSPAEHAQEIAAARDRLVAFAADCSDETWHERPLTADGDPRPVGVIIDHVGHSYEYLAGWVREVLAGESPEVTADLVDGLNAEHARACGHLTQADAVEHLTRSGDELIAFIAGLADADLDAGDGRVRRFAEVATRHADNHRAEIEQALGG